MLQTQQALRCSDVPPMNRSKPNRVSSRGAVNTPPVPIRQTSAAGGVGVALGCTRARVPLVCSTTRPGFLPDCTPLEGLECPYVEDCCGTSQTVSARCTNGVWKLYGAGRSACSVCTTAHSDGEACNLPADCAHASCFVTSCYGQPLVEDCIDGVWRVATPAVSD